MAEKIIYAISDSLGETAEAVARATASQYDKEQIEIVRIPYIDSESQIDEIIADAKRGNHVICHTIVSESLRKYLHEKVAEYNRIDEIHGLHGHATGAIEIDQIALPLQCT